MSEIVLVGYVQTPEGEAALEHGIDEAMSRAGRLIVVHSSRGGLHEDAEKVVAAERRLSEIDEQLEHKGLEHEVRSMVLGNAPAEDILNVATEVGATLIVVGVRRRSAVGKFILGSNAQDVLLRADCPVLAVKPPE